MFFRKILLIIVFLQLTSNFFFTFSVLSENKIENNSLSKDSTIKVDAEHLDLKVNYLEKNINTRIDYVEKNINSRYDTAFNFITVIVSLLVIIVGGLGYFIYTKGRLAARETAKSEFERKFRVYHDRIIQIETEAVKNLNEIKVHSDSVSKMRISMEKDISTVKEISTTKTSLDKLVIKLDNWLISKKEK